MKKSSLLCFVAFLHFTAVAKGSHAYCNNRSCDSNETQPLYTTTTTTVTFASQPSCNVSLGTDRNSSGNGSVYNLTSGAVYQIFLGCFNCCQPVTMKPREVTNLTVNNVTTSSINVSWTKPEGNFSFFMVRWSHGKDGDKENTSMASKDITDLTAGTMYNIVVTAVADDNVTKGVDATLSQYTRPGSVRELSVDTNTSSISLTWKQPDGEVLTYKVQWHNGGEQLLRETRNTFAVLSDLVSGKAYTIVMFSIAGDNKTEGDPYLFTAVTKPAVVRDLQITDVTTSSISLKWTKPEGNASGYKLHWTPEGKEDSFNTTFTINNLIPGNNYNITVSAVAGNDSNTGQETLISTFTRPEKPENIGSTPGTDNLIIVWTLPQHGRADKYVVNISNEELSYFSSNETQSKTAQFSGLYPGRRFLVTVTAVAGNQNNPSNQIPFATLPCPVLNLVASPFNTTAIQVAWSYPQKLNFTYIVQIYNATGTLVKELQVRDVNSTIVTDLEPGTRYNVSVTTLAAAGSESTAVQTFTYTMPKAVTALRVKDVNTTAITLTWLRQSDHKDSYAYLATMSQDGKVLHNVSTKTEIYTFSGLTPGASYSFEVFTVVEGVKSTGEYISSYTRPSPVSDILLIGTTTNMSVYWSAPVGQVDSYTVQLNRHSKSVINATLNTTFTDLKPGVLYCVVVISKSGPFESNSSSVCNATFPNPPGSISVQSQTVDSINFTWMLPDDMDQDQYNFSVSSVSGFSTTTNNWFMLTKLQSGTRYSLSVETIAVLGYKSIAVTANNYTRPYSVTMLRAGEISTDSVVLVWEQPENKSDYSYVVHYSNESSNPQFKVVSRTFVNISDLLSGNNYTFAVSTQTADGTLAAPRIKSVFTRPFEINKLKAHTINSTAIRLTWMKPQEHKPEYTYRIETTDCSSQNKTVEEDFALISELPPGTQCSFSVFVQAGDGIEGRAKRISQYTKPERVQPSISSLGSNISVLVSWMSPPGKVENYSVYLNTSSMASQPQPVQTTNNSLLFEGLSAGSLYSATVMSYSGPFNATSEFVTNATFPNPPGPIEILRKTNHSIEVRWSEAALMTEGSFYYELTSMPSEEYECMNTTNTSHTFEPLLSGTPYNISIATVGVLGFRSEKVHAYLVTTKPLGVKYLNTSEEEENITVKWTQPDDYKEDYLYYLAWKSSDQPISGNVLTGQTVHTIENLEPGSSYNFTVVSETSDGTQGAARSISSCTDASPVRNVSCEGPDKTDAEIVLSWTKPRGQFHGFRITVNNSDTVDFGTCNESCSQTISNLRHYTTYQLMMETLSCGQPATPVFLHCKTGITDPPIPINYESLVNVTDKVYNRFTIQINPSLLLDTHGPITHFGVLITDNVNAADTSNMTQYLEKTYQQWEDKDTSTYLATVKERNVLSRSQETNVVVDIGDGSEWEGYTNGALHGNGRYQYAIVLFTRLSLQDNLVKAGSSGSKASITNFYSVINLPQDPVVISIAVGATLGIFCVLVIVLIGFIVYWRRLSSKETSDIQIHSMRSAAVSVEDYEAYYRKQKADSNCGFAEEFEDLRFVGTCQSKANAETQENKAKNRYNNVLPYDSSRVKLSIIHGSPYDDYINANYMPGYNSRKEFIAAQGPLASTVKDFWRMIWEKNVHTLVMLTRCNEQGRIKCEQYWYPGSKHFEYISVTTTSEIPLDDWTIRDFDIKNVKTAETRSVRQFHFTAWPDHGVPETTELLISFRHLVREHMDQYSTNSPTVVHCSAGVGRTGTFIAIDRLIFQIEIDNVVDVYGNVHDLRMHRPLMVQTEDQYVFLNQCAMDLIRSRTGTNVDLIYQNTAALSIYENVEPKKVFYK